MSALPNSLAELDAMIDGASNHGAEQAAKLLRVIAETGQHNGIFGGVEMETAAQAILALWRPLPDTPTTDLVFDIPPLSSRTVTLHVTNVGRGKPSGVWDGEPSQPAGAWVPMDGAEAMEYIAAVLSGEKPDDVQLCRWKPAP